MLCVTYCCMPIQTTVTITRMVASMHARSNKLSSAFSAGSNHAFLVQVQQGLIDFLCDPRQNRLMLLVLSRRVEKGSFTLSTPRMQSCIRLGLRESQWPCLVVSGDAVTIFLSDGRQLQKPGGNMLQPHEALDLIDEVKQLSGIGRLQMLTSSHISNTSA